jgi:hypothetical protein
MEGDLAAFRVVQRMVPTVVIDPDPEKKAKGEQAVDDGTEGEIHGSRVTADRGETQRQSHAKTG